MELLLTVLFLIAVAIPLAIAMRRSTELFVLRVNGGKTRFVRGRIPQSLFDELDDVLRRSDSDGLLRVYVERGEARIDTRGTFSDGTQQRLRNVIGTVPLQRIRAGSRPRRD